MPRVIGSAGVVRRPRVLALPVQQHRLRAVLPTAPPHQRYLQTFHGYPFKSMGIDFWRSKGFTDEEVQRAVDRAQPRVGHAADAERGVRRLLPRAVRLPRRRCWSPATRAATSWSTTTPPSSAATVLARLGVAEDQTVVLYAPTYRDRLTTRAFAAAALRRPRPRAAWPRCSGPGYTLLVRGHNNNQRELDRVTGHGAGRRRHRLPRHQRADPGRRRGGARLLLAAIRLGHHRQADGVLRAGHRGLLRAAPRRCSPTRAPRPARGPRRPRRSRRRWPTSTACARRTPPTSSSSTSGSTRLHDGHASERVLAAFFADARTDA